MKLAFICQFLEEFSSISTYSGYKIKNIIDNVNTEKNLTLIMPYANISKKFISKLQILESFHIHINKSQIKILPHLYKDSEKGINIYFLEHYHPNEDSINIIEDHLIIESLLFAMSSSAFIKEYKLDFDIIHSYDWFTYFFPIYHKNLNRDKCSILIHSIENLEKYILINKEWISYLSLPKELFHMNCLEFYGDISLLKGAVIFSDQIIINSRTIYHDISASNFKSNLSDFYLSHIHKIYPINKGLNSKHWDPAKDKSIFSKYDIKTLSKRIINKKHFQNQHFSNFNTNIPLIGVIIDMTDSDYTGMILELFKILLSHPVQCIVLSIEDAFLYRKFSILNNPSNDNFFFSFGFNDKMLHRTLASCDILITAPRILNNTDYYLKSLKYGCIPITADSPYSRDFIIDLIQSPEKGNGYILNDYNTGALFDLLLKVIQDFRKKDNWNSVIKRAMSVKSDHYDISREYEILYGRIAGAGFEPATFGL